MSCSIDNDWFYGPTECLFSFLYPNELYCIVVLSVVKQKMFPYTQSIPLGALSVVYNISPFSLSVEQLHTLYPMTSQVWILAL